MKSPSSHWLCCKVCIRFIIMFISKPIMFRLLFPPWPFSILSGCTVTYRPASGAGAVSSDVMARSTVLTGAATLALGSVTTRGTALSTSVARVTCQRSKVLDTKCIYISLHHQTMRQTTCRWKNKRVFPDSSDESECVDVTYTAPV